MLVLTLCYRIIGFVREMLVASYLGTSAEADAYSIAYSVPTVVVEMLALGAIGSASIAVFQSVLQKDGKQRLNQLYSRVMAAILLALAVISALFLWVMALAVAGTAHEGVPFGKRFSSLWMPLRFVGAMGALAPIFKGLSLFQVAILACIGFSINLGNFVWELGTDYFVEHAGQITVQAPDQNVTHYAAITNISCIHNFFKFINS